ncbi:MAG TPA: hypothetical protein VLL75_23105 [Vicinamibacteria bacterium]|nr:hypothetical protein [Vicinamibacteria bacterium]
MSIQKLAVFATVLVFGMGSVAVAAGRRSLEVDLQDETSLGGTKVPAGKYKISWAGNEGETEVKVMRGRELVATGRGKLVERPQASPDDQVVSRKDATGAFVLSEIHVRGEKRVLVL